MFSKLEGFKQTMLEKGIICSEAIIADGQLYRFHVEGDKFKSQNGWYILFDNNGVLAGTFGSWKTGEIFNWCSHEIAKLSAAEKVVYQQQLAEAKAKREETLQQSRAAAKHRANAIFEAGQPANDNHPYLQAKKVTAYGLRLRTNGALIIPLFDNKGIIHSLQFIYANGNKRFLFDGAIQGHYFKIGVASETIYLCEGYATGATIFEATGALTIVAFNAGNLLPVAQAIRAQYPHSQLIVCADNDQYSSNGNVGLDKAMTAAKAINGYIAVPSFQDTTSNPTDFNDLYLLEGLSAVKEQLNNPVLAAADSTLNLPIQAPDSPALTVNIADETISRLAALSSIEYEQVRSEIAKQLNVRASVLDSLVKKARSNSQQQEKTPFAIIQPWHEHINPADLLTETANTIQNFIVCEPETAYAAALWIAMTWFINAVQVAPLAVITAPEKRCGKSQLLFLLRRLVNRPLLASNITPAALFRSIDAWQPTLLIDEADAFMRENEELRGILNCGHTRDSAYIVRVVGDEHEPKTFYVWGAKALAGIGHLADTLMDRAITLELRRKLPHEKVERLRHVGPELFETLAAKFARFAQDYAEAVKDTRPDLPDTLHDRAQDNWEPLIAIAQVAGGDWPKMALAAALKLSVNEEQSQSISIELLQDIQEIFETRRIDRITSAELIAALCEDEEKSWASYNRGAPIKPRQVAKRLKEFGISSNTIRTGITTAKGYHREQFIDAFQRYLHADKTVTSVTPSQPVLNQGFAVTDDGPVTEKKVTLYRNVTHQLAISTGCDVVTHVTDNRERIVL